MNKAHTLFRTLLFTLLLTCGAASLSASPEGYWEGHILLPQQQKLAIEVSLQGDGATGWKGEISIPAQGLRDFGLSEVESEGDSISFSMSGIPGTPRFTGNFDASSQRIEGDFSQGGQNLTFELKRAEKSEQVDSRSPVSDKGLPGEGAVGEWFGELEVGPARLRLALRLSNGVSGRLTGSMDSLDQNVNGLNLDSAQFLEGRLTFEINRIAGKYDGSLNADGSELVGTWTQGGQSFPLTFRRIAEPVVLNRPQEPKPPYPFTVEEVRFRNEAAGIRLAGTLVIPEGEAPFPAVVFLSGSGPQDRDESLMGHRPFLVLADALARCGVASLRYDDRGFMESEGDHMGSTTQDFAKDALAALRYLESRSEIDPSWVGMVGHSEGGLMAPMAASFDAAVDFLVLLAPPGEPLDQLLLRQYTEIWRSKGLDEELVQRLRKLTEVDLKLISDLHLTAEELKEKLRERISEYEEQISEEERKALDMTEGAFETSLLTVSTKWFRNLMRIDPAVYLEQVRVPVLALFGEKDIQVAAAVNAAALETALRKAATPSFEIEILPGLNHLFQNCETGNLDEYGQIEETFSPMALERVCDWIMATVKGKST